MIKKFYIIITFVALCVSLYDFTSEETKEDNDLIFTPPPSYIIPLLGSFRDLIFESDEDIAKLSDENLDHSLMHYGKDILKISRQLKDLCYVCEEYQKHFNKLFNEQQRRIIIDAGELPTLDTGK